MEVVRNGLSRLVPGPVGLAGARLLRVLMGGNVRRSRAVVKEVYLILTLNIMLCSGTGGLALTDETKNMSPRPLGAEVLLLAAHAGSRGGDPFGQVHFPLR